MKKYPKFRTFHRTFLVRFFFKSWHFVRDIDFVKNVPNFEIALNIKIVYLVSQSWHG